MNTILIYLIVVILLLKLAAYILMAVLIFRNKIYESEVTKQDLIRDNRFVMYWLVVSDMLMLAALYFQRYN